MAIIKCKMCGGDLALTESSSIAECEYCGSRQTVPVADSEKKLTLFARANRLRAGCEFDKAAGIYEAIVAEFPQEAEAYWGLVLCKYGIEYVDDPATGRKIPTCHRSSFDSVLEDGNFDQAMENADEIALGVYRQEAKQIEGIRQGILAVSSSEKPYDIFICYKETDTHGDRSVDSLLAQDIYDALTDKGYRVFFSRITLEDKLGQAYEPYIFAALNSAKIMLAVGTCYEHYNAVWVKNEWSRYLKIIAQDKGKYLIPCYKNIDAYDIPKEFAHLQGQDMGKVGAIADLLRGIEKLMPQGIKTPEQDTAGNGKLAALLKRGHMALEDCNWAAADRIFEEVLNNDIKNAHGYLGKLLAEYQISKTEDLGTCTADFTSSYNYQKAQQFGNRGIHEILENAGNDKIYYAARKLMEENTKSDCQKAIAQFATIPGWRDADKLAAVCRSRIEEIEAARKKTRSKAAQGKQKPKAIPLVVAAVVLVAIAGILLLKPSAQTERIEAETVTVDPQEAAYLAAISLMEEGKYEDAMAAFTQLAGYADSETQMENCRLAIETAAMEAQYQEAEALAAEGKHAHAGLAFNKLGDYKDSRDRSFEEWGYTRRRTTIANGSGYKESFQIGLKNDGTVITTGSNAHGQREVDYWTDIVEVGAISVASVGLRADGTIVTAGESDWQPYMDMLATARHWTDIVTFIIGYYGDTIYGLKNDGTVVVAVSYPESDVSYLADWTDIVSICQMDGGGIIGLRADGTVVGNGLNGQSFEGWENVISLTYSDQGYFTLGKQIMGLCADGTVYVQWNNYPMEADDLVEYTGKIEQWTDIVEICGQMGLHADGTVSVFPEDSRYVSGSDGINTTSPWADAIRDWEGIVALRGNGGTIYGLKADGTVLTAGEHYNGSDNVTAWTDIQDIIQSVYTIGIQSDGSLVVAEYVNSELEKWTDIRLP